MKIRKVLSEAKQLLNHEQSKYLTIEYAQSKKHLGELKATFKNTSTVIVREFYVG